MLSGLTNETLVIVDNSSHKGGYQLQLLVQDFPVYEFTHERV